MKALATFLVAVSCALCGPASSVHAQPAAAAAAANSVSGIQASQQGGDVLVKLSFAQPIAKVPASFTIANPPRIAFDLADVGNASGQSAQTFNLGELRSANIVQVGNRTRVVLNLNRLTPYETRVDGGALLVVLKPVAAPSAAAAPEAARFAEAQPGATRHAIRDLNFRRGKDGEGRVVVDLTDAGTGIDIRQQGANLVVEFIKTTAPQKVLRKLDVTDFATPITSVATTVQGENVRMVVSPKGLWEHNAYQSDNQFVLEVRPIKEDPNKMVQGSRPGYQGEKLSLNFQNVDVRAVLQVIADFTNLNIITSDTVSGNITLRLKDVPWDQALDIILQAKGLDKRKNGNVVWIAPRDELAARDKLDLESRAQITDLEPLRTESFQLNYQRAKAVFDILKNKDQTMLSKRGTVIVDERTNKLFVSDVAMRLDDLRRLLGEIDIPVRQVMIEARIVEADDRFNDSIGTRLGLHDRKGEVGGQQVFGQDGLRATVGANLNDTTFHTGQIGTPVPNLNDFTNVNLAASAIGGRAPGAMSLVLFNSSATRFLNLEISALEADGKGKVISSPRVVTADQVEALIESGKEIPYQQSTSSGATSVSFRKATLSLKVKPQITPDGRIMLKIDVNKDTPDPTIVVGGTGVAIDTKHVSTEVLVENGGTLVIGGIYQQDTNRTQTRIPFFGDLPYVGFLFRNTERRDVKTELLVFITPKVVAETLTLR